jgi:hypothetical protein
MYLADSHDWGEGGVEDDEVWIYLADGHDWGERSVEDDEEWKDEAKYDEEDAVALGVSILPGRGTTETYCLLCIQNTKNTYF